LLAPHELPDFVNLNPLTGQVPHGLIKELGTGRAKLDQKLQDGMLSRAGYTNRGVDRALLDEASNYLSPSGCIHPVHVSIMLARA
jgi:hypothetical protein